MLNWDHNTIRLTPTYKTVLKSSKPITKTVTVCSKDSIEALNGSFLCTDWNIFHNLYVAEATDTITDDIKFCEGYVADKKVIATYPNNEPTVHHQRVQGVYQQKNGF